MRKIYIQKYLKAGTLTKSRTTTKKSTTTSNNTATPTAPIISEPGPVKLPWEELGISLYIYNEALLDIKDGKVSKDQFTDADSYNAYHKQKWQEWTALMKERQAQDLENSRKAEEERLQKRNEEAVYEYPRTEEEWENSMYSWPAYHKKYPDKSWNDYYNDPNYNWGHRAHQKFGQSGQYRYSVDYNANYNPRNYWHNWYPEDDYYLYRMDDFNRMTSALSNVDTTKSGELTGRYHTLYDTLNYNNMPSGMVEWTGVQGNQRTGSFNPNLWIRATNAARRMLDINGIWHSNNPYEVMTPEKEAKLKTWFDNNFNGQSDWFRNFDDFKHWVLYGQNQDSNGNGGMNLTNDAQNKANALQQEFDQLRDSYNRNSGNSNYNNRLNPAFSPTRTLTNANTNNRVMS